MKKKPKFPASSEQALVEQLVFIAPAPGESTDSAYKRSLKASPTFHPSRKHIVKVKPRILKKQKKKEQTGKGS